MEEQLETAVDTNTTTSDRLNANRTAAVEYDCDTIIDPVNEHRDDPANTTSASAASRSKSEVCRAPRKKYSSSGGKRATGTNADLNHRDPGTDEGDDEDRHRETIILYNDPREKE